MASKIDLRRDITSFSGVPGATLQQLQHVHSGDTVQ